jgi:hypothetical protein
VLQVWRPANLMPSIPLHGNEMFADRIGSFKNNTAAELLKIPGIYTSLFPLTQMQPEGIHHAWHHLSRRLRRHRSGHPFFPWPRLSSFQKSKTYFFKWRHGIMADTIQITDSAPDLDSYMNWSAVVAGGLVAVAYSFVMLIFGASGGLSLASAFALEGTSQTVLLIAGGLWLVWVQVSAFALGGYIAGRIRPRSPVATDHEVEVRDGIHGVLVWAVGALIGFMLAISATGSVLGFSGNAAVSLASSDSASGASPAAVATDVAVDTLFRMDTPGERVNGEVRSEVGRILTPALVGTTIADDDRTYIARLIANQTPLTVAEAQTRVDTVLQHAGQAAEKARKAMILIGFITVASLLVSAAAAWWAADLGGSHRDSGTDFSRYTGWRTRMAGGVGHDDLTAIKGIGPSLKNKLYKMNIKTFEQIAAFSAEDIVRVNAKLSFPGRIEREKWVEQARDFAGS